MSTSTTDTETTLSPIRIEAENYDTSNTDVTVYTTTDEKWSGHSVSLWHNSDHTPLMFQHPVPMISTARVVAP